MPCLVCALEHDLRNLYELDLTLCAVPTQDLVKEQPNEGVYVIIVTRSGKQAHRCISCWLRKLLLSVMMSKYV